jgi:23S rRNA (guanine2445-N2)-methyltransferase / 23S rRNA (guanine2069-N7)-methyltransferase
MCGSGTLLIEGAFMAADIAPGLLRDYYGFLHWKPFEPEAWRRLLEEARERREAGLRRLPPLYGFDSDARAVGTARNNARAAGLAGRVVFERRELASLVPPQRPGGRASSPASASDAAHGLVVTNPPYGKRLGEVAKLVEVYEQLGERLKSGFSGWETAVFTGNPELGAHLGLRAHRVNVLFNGPIECRLLLFCIGPAALVGRHTKETEEEPPDSAGAGSVMFENRLRKNFKHMRRWAAREDIHCYRLYDADLPEYAAAVDLYEDWAHVQEYAPPSTVDPVRARRRVKEMVAAVPRVLEIPPSHVVLKVRRRQRGSDQYERLKDEGRFIEVREGGLRLLVNLTDYLDTGLFLDHRVTRGLIRDLAKGRRFLNLFGYTGSATVYAAAGGAPTTTTVDLSLTYLDWARRNLELNGLLTAKHSFVRADCVEWLRTAAKTPTADGGRRGALGTGRAGAPGTARPTPGSASPRATEYDLIFLDAPTFSNSKAMASDLDIQRDHAGLIRAAARLLPAHGILLFSTNFRHFKLEPALQDEFQVEDMTRQTIPPDFSRNPRIHQCFRIMRLTPQRQGGPRAG